MSPAPLSRESLWCPRPLQIETYAAFPVLIALVTLFCCGLESADAANVTRSQGVPCGFKFIHSLLRFTERAVILFL